MKKFLQRVFRFFAYMAAAVVILLAIAVGLFRLFLPRVPEYQEEIKDWASTAIGMQVEFSGMDARWGLSGPELRFYDAELNQLDSGMRVVAAQEVGLGVGLRGRGVVVAHGLGVLLLLGVAVIAAAVVAGVGRGHDGLDLGDRDDGQELQEQEEQRAEQAERACEHADIDPRRVELRP